MCSHAVMDDRNDETEISNCKVESDQQVITKEDLTAYKIMCNMYFWMCKMCLFMSICNTTEKKKSVN